MSEIILGQPADASQIGWRDALHVPVVCVRAHRRLAPGEYVGVIGDSTKDGEVGVADPFRRTYIEYGSVCAVLLLPKSTGNVRHVWEHPEIPTHPAVESRGDAEKDARQDWGDYLNACAELLGVGRYLLEDSIEHMIEYGSDTGGCQPNLDQDTLNRVDWREFWERYNEAYGTSYAWDSDPFCC